MIPTILETLAESKISGSKRFFIPALLPTLNEYTRTTRSNLYASANMKKRAEERIAWEIRSQLKRWNTSKPVFLIFHWVERDKRRDHDNVAFAKKFVQDALVKMKVIQGDGWKHVVGFLDLFSVNKERFGVEVIIVEVGDE